METIQKREAWHKGKLIGQKPPLKPKDIWATCWLACFGRTGGQGRQSAPARR